MKCSRTFKKHQRSILCLPRLHLYDQTVKITNIVKYYFNLLKLNSIFIFLNCNVLLWWRSWIVSNMFKKMFYKFCWTVFVLFCFGVFCTRFQIWASGWCSPWCWIPFCMLNNAKWLCACQYQFFTSSLESVLKVMVLFKVHELLA